MSYGALYEYCQDLPVPVSRKHIIPKVCELTKRARKPRIMAYDLDPAIVAGFIVWPGNNDHPIGKFGKGEPVIVIARQHNTCWRRFVVVKELMHYFDRPLEKVNSEDDFEEVVSGFCSPVPPDHRSPAMGSEANAFWMALGVLCPEPLRQDLQRDRARGAISDMEIAQRLKIPLAFVPALFQPHFKESMSELCDC